MSDETGERYKTTVTASCPFCDGSFSDMCDPNTGKPEGLMHSMPMCEQFDTLGIADFLEAVNAVNRTAAFDPLAKREPGKA